MDANAAVNAVRMMVSEHDRMVAEVARLQKKLDGAAQRCADLDDEIGRLKDRLATVTREAANANNAYAMAQKLLDNTLEANRGLRAALRAEVADDPIVVDARQIRESAQRYLAAECAGGVQA